MKKLGYLVPEFPGQTHAFFWREACAIEDHGTPVQLLSTRRPLPEACPHGFRDDAVARTHYLFPPSVAALGALLSRPARSAKGLGYIASLRETPVKGRARLLALLPVAAGLFKLCRSEGIEHVHIHSCANAAHLGALLNILGGPSYSLTLHGDLPVYGTDHSAKFADARFVSAVTHPLAEQIAEVSPKLRNPVVWMGVDCGSFRPTAHTRKAGDPLNVITVARLNNTKGHVFTLEAVARLVQEGHDIRYRIVGEGPKEAEIKADIERLGLSDRVVMEGAFGQDQVREALGQADVLTLTSFGLGEAAPVTVMEAMASGLPVIVSHIGGTPDMVSDGTDADLTPQQDVEAITEALRRHANDPEHSKKIGTAARQTALAKFDYQANAKKLLNEILV